MMGADPCFPEQLGLVIGCQGAQRAGLGEPGPDKTLPEDRRAGLGAWLGTLQGTWLW